MSICGTDEYRVRGVKCVSIDVLDGGDVEDQCCFFFFFFMIRRPPRSTLSSSSAASDVYKRQIMIDPETRDIIQDQHVHEVVKSGGRLKIKVLSSISQVKDPCKANQLGKCASN